MKTFRSARKQLVASLGKAIEYSLYESPKLHFPFSFQKFILETSDFEKQQQVQVVRLALTLRNRSDKNSIYKKRILHLAATIVFFFLLSLQTRRYTAGLTSVDNPPDIDPSLARITSTARSSHSFFDRSGNGSNTTMGRIGVGCADVGAGGGATLLRVRSADPQETPPLSLFLDLAELGKESRAPSPLRELLSEFGSSSSLSKDGNMSATSDGGIWGFGGTSNVLIRIVVGSSSREAAVAHAPGADELRDSASGLSPVRRTPFTSARLACASFEAMRSICFSVFR